MSAVVESSRPRHWDTDRHLTILVRYIGRQMEEQRLDPKPSRERFIARLQAKARRLQSELGVQMCQEGYFHREWSEWHGSETQGPDVQSRDRDDAYFYARTRNDDDRAVLARWGQPNDLDRSDPDWEGKMVEYRRIQLDHLLRTYFGTHRYLYKQMVTRWKKRNGRWVPAEKVYVRSWIDRQAELYGELAGLTGCVVQLKAKVTRQ